MRKVNKKNIAKKYQSTKIDTENCKWNVNLCMKFGGGVKLTKWTGHDIRNETTKKQK